MEITDSVQIEILNTLQKIERINKAIAFHKAMDLPDALAIEQYKQVKEQLAKQLIGLLENIDVKLQMAA